MSGNEAIPPEVTTAVAEFMSAGRTGNIQLNIKDGKILGAHVEEILTFKSNRPRLAKPHSFGGRGG